MNLTNVSDEIPSLKITAKLDISSPLTIISGISYYTPEQLLDFMARGRLALPDFCGLQKFFLGSLSEGA